MDDNASAQAWAEQHFGGAQLKDRRRTWRLVHSAAKIALHPSQTFPQIFGWNELRGFYNLCAQAAVTLESVQRCHWEQTRRAMAAQRQVVLTLHDTSELEFTAHAALKDIGPIGEGHGRGFLQHNSLAVLPKPRQVLGLAFQQLRLREPAPEGERADQRKKRDRESMLWLNGIRGVGRAPAECCWVDVGDRGSDIYEAMVASLEMDHHFLFRVAQNRQVFTTPTHDQTALLRDYACGLASQGQDVVDIPGRGGRPARRALVQLAGAPVWVPAPAGTPQRSQQPVIAAWVIRVWEADPPPGLEPLEWILLCSLSSTTLEELKERRDWYCCRWIVEMFHDVEKNGCAEEARRFETAERMAPCLALLAVVAVRVLQMRFALESQPDAPAQQVATPAEIEVVRRVTRHKGRSMTVRDFVRGVARLGGFLGRKCDGNPGVRTLWRGYQRLQDMLLGMKLHADTRSDDG